MKDTGKNTLPVPLTPEAQKEQKRFNREYRKYLERIKKISFTILVWGQSEENNTLVSQKRVSIRDHLRRNGHNAIFSESLSDDNYLQGLSEKSKEFAQAQAAHIIIILLEGSPGALAEAHDFCNHPDLTGKFYIMIPECYKDGYSAKGAIKDLSDGYGGVYWYHEGEIESCNVLNMASTRVEARRNIQYRQAFGGEAY